MKQFVKGLLVGGLCTLLLIGTPGLAQGVKAMIDVYFNHVTLQVDGEVVSVDNILYNGTTYAPLRAVAEMVGKQVDFDNQSKTVLIHDKDTPPLDHEKNANMAVKGISIDEKETAVLEQLGQPAYKVPSIYGFEWYVYNQDYANYLQVGIKDGVVQGIFSHTGDWKLKGTIGIGTEMHIVAEVFGARKQEVKEGNSVYQLSSSSEEALYEVDDLYVKMYFDSLTDNKVMGTLILSKDIPFRSIYYGDFSQVDLERLADAYEQQIFDLCNGVRVQQGMHPFEWDEAIATVARAHSTDMAENNFFDHTNLQGKSPSDRIKEYGLTYWATGENIAYGQRNALQAYVGWMNSSGHRKNILADYTHLGVGVIIREGDLQPYYTQNFYTPR